MSKIINLENLKPIVNKIEEQKTLIEKLQNENKVLKLDVESLNYLINGDCSEDKLLNGIGKSVAIPSGTAPKGEILSLGGNIEKDDTLTSRAGVVGNTKKYNQLADFSYLSTPITEYGVSESLDSNGYVSLNGTSTDSFSIYSPIYVSSKADHKYLMMSFCNKATSGLTIYLTWALSGADYNGSGVISSGNGNDIRAIIRIGASGIDLNGYKLKPILVDLTDMYGAGNEPTTVAQFLQDYPQYNSYVPHTETTLSSPKFTEMELCGENLFDKNNSGIELNRRVNATNGNLDGLPNVFCTNYIEIKPNENYVISDIKGIGALTSQVCVFYDKNKNYISGIGGYTSSTEYWQLTTPSGAKYIRFNGLNANIDITMFSKGSSVSTFKPYNGQTLTIPEQTLNGQDEIYSYVEGNELVVKKITRYGSVDLGTLRWEVTNGLYHTTGLTNAKYSSQWKINNTHYICSKYEEDVGDNVAYKIKDKTITLNPQSRIMIYDSSFTNVTDFTNSLNGVMLVYELAQPTITEIARVPLTCDFKQIENVITNNTQFAQETQNIQKGVVVASMTEKVETIGSTTNIDSEVFSNSYIYSNGSISSSSYYQINVFKLKKGQHFYLKNYQDVERYYAFTTTKPTTTTTFTNIVSFSNDFDFVAQEDGYLSITLYTSKLTNVKFVVSNSYLLSQLAQIKERVGDITLGYIDFDRKVFVKNKDKVDLGTISWEIEGNNVLFSNSIANRKPNTEMICNVFRCDITGDWGDYSQLGEDIVYQKSDSTTIIRFKKSHLYSLENLISYIKGAILYYSLAQPQEIDLSDILDDSDNAIRLEENGSVEFSDTTEYNIHYARKVN